MINVAVISGQSTTVVPNISGLTSSEALAALTAAELTVGSTSTTQSGADASNNGKVQSQDISFGTVVERYSSVGYTTYYYVPPVVPDPPSWTDSSISNSFQSGTAYSDSVSATNGASYTWEYVDTGNGTTSSQFWPAGVTINNSSGAISGTPTTSGQLYSFRILAYNSGGTITSGNYAGTVAAASGGGGGGGGGGTPPPQQTCTGSSQATSACASGYGYVYSCINPTASGVACY